MNHKDLTQSVYARFPAQCWPLRLCALPPLARCAAASVIWWDAVIDSEDNSPEWDKLTTPPSGRDHATEGQSILALMQVGYPMRDAVERVIGYWEKESKRTQGYHLNLPTSDLRYDNRCGMWGVTKGKQDEGGVRLHAFPEGLLTP